MEKNDNFIEAFVHCQLAIEKILFDMIAKSLGTRIELKLNKFDKNGKEIQPAFFKTSELIRWSYLIGAIGKEEYNDLQAFNRSRNRIVHTHGKWWEKKEFRQNLSKGITFMEKNDM